MFNNNERDNMNNPKTKVQLLKRLIGHMMVETWFDVSV